MAVPDSEISDVPETPAGEAAAARTYAYRIDGLGDADSLALLTQFRALSALEEYRGDPANAAQIDRRARADADLLAELMRAYGYDALVTTRVDAAPGGAFAVALEVQPGPLYRFAEVRLPGLDEATGADAPALREAFISPQDPVNAAEVGAAQAALQAELGRRGYAFAELGEPDIVIDHDSRTATLVLPVEPQGTRRFGRILIDGAPLFSADHLATIARFDEGDPYRTPLVEDLRQALVATGLISSVTIRPVARPESDLVDIAVGIEPAPMRTIAGEAGYGTGEGVRAELSWQHRNLLPPEGAVTLRGVIGTREQLLSGVLRRNNFLRRDQVLNAQVAASHTDRPAYSARTFVLAGGIERQSNIIWQKAWTWSVGAELTATDERDVDLASGTTRAAPSSSARCRPSSAMTGRTTCSTRPAASACRRASRRGVAQIRQLLLCPRPDRRQLLPALVGDGDPRRPHPLGHHLRRQPRPHRAVAPLLCRRRRLGARLRLPGARAARPGVRRSDRRRSLAEFAIEARVPGRRLRHRALLRRRQHLDLALAALRQSALRRRHRRALPPASGRSASTSRRRSTRSPAIRASPSTSRSARPFDRHALEPLAAPLGAGRSRGLRRWTLRDAFSSLAKAIVVLALTLMLISAALVAFSTPARATASSSTASPR